MPVYEYKCPHGHVFELFHGITQPAPEVCAICGEGPVTRVLHPVAVHFKGSGFYSTDYGRGGRKARDGDKPEKADGEKKKESEKKAPARGEA